ncbi:MAG: ParB N-terminal domain-containing protein [Phycisphaerales bacterium]|nr:ParB N-terminal domain-containing protein [Phycisphaerales bacterium]
MLNVELRSIDSIKPYDRNPRKNDAAVEHVARSIRLYGFRQPLVVDKDGVIVVGHTRLKAAASLGMTQVPVHVATDLTPEQAKAYRLADNRSAEIAQWDDELLAAELEQLRSLDVDLSSLGWDPDELEALLAPAGGEVTDPDDLPEAPAAGNAVTRPGDLWLLGGPGGHRLLCGNSTRLADVQRVMNGKRAALVATDPPYLVDYTGERVGDSGKDWSDVYHEVEIEDAEGFFRSLFKNILEVIAPHAAIYCWHAHKRQATIARIWEELGILDHQQVIWVKPTAVFGSVFYHFKHEPCMLGWVQGSKPAHDGDHTFNSIWEVDWEGKARIIGNQHPTQKPVELFARPMRKHTQRGAVCFEPFSGSGSQIIAAEREGRRCYAIELEPVFVDVAVKRWQRATGKRAVHEASGKTFDEMTRERTSENAPAPEGDEA